jgi:hypothetical protein
VAVCPSNATSCACTGSDTTERRAARLGSAAAT